MTSGGNILMIYLIINWLKFVYLWLIPDFYPP